MTSTFTVTVARLFMKEQKIKILKDMSNVFMMDKRTKANLKNHVKVVHERNYKCRQCGKKFEPIKV